MQSVRPAHDLDLEYTSSLGHFWAYGYRHTGSHTVPLTNELRTPYRLVNDLAIKYVDFSHNHTNLVKLIVSMNAISNEVIFSCKVDCKLECYFQPSVGFL